MRCSTSTHPTERCCTGLALVLLLASAGSSALAATIRVPADQPTIQAALNVTTPGDIVLVAPGTYSGPGNRDLDFLGKDVALRSEAGAATTVIDCEAAGRGFYFHTGETNQATVEGFTIQNGRSLHGGAFLIGLASPSVVDCFIRACSAELLGGGVYCESAAPTFTRCIIANNGALQAGGGLYFQNSSPTVLECSIRDNSGRLAGGGVVLLRCQGALLEDCVLLSNGGGTQGGGGGGIVAEGSALTLRRCSFNGNSSCVGGGVVAWSSTLIVTDCSFMDNYAHDGIGYEAEGGAISSTQGHVTIQNSEFRHNRVTGGDSPVRGGALASTDVVLMITDCLFADNQIQSSKSPGYGGALSVIGPGEVEGSVFFRNVAPSGSAIHVGSDSSPLSLDRSTLAFNSTTAGGAIHLLGGTLMTAHQTIIAFSTAGEAVRCEDQSSASLSCCDLFNNAGGDWTGCIAGQQQGDGNLTLDPLFCDLGAGILTLDAASPCAPGNSGSCGLIGALPVDCGVQATTPTTWGHIKSEYLR